MSLPLGLSSVVLGGLNLGTAPTGGTDFVLTSVDGWNGKPKPTIRVTQRPRAGGGWAGISYPSSRHVALSGWFFTDTDESLQAAEDELNAAFGLDETLMTVTQSGVRRWVMARNEDDVIVNRISESAASWSGQVVVLDWRKFGDELSGTTVLPSSSGGLLIPFTVPFTINATTVSGQVSLNNPGNEVGPVRLRIDGPCTGPVVTHVSSGAQLVFSSSLVLGVGEWLDVDMEAHTVLANGQSSRAGWVTRRGWSGFNPADNTWSFTAAQYDPASQLTVFATPAWA